MATEKPQKKKAKRPTAEKRMLQNEKQRHINRTYKAQVRTAIRRFTDAMGQNDAPRAKEYLGNVYSLVDKCVKKGIYKRNKASRAKARLAAKLATFS